MSDLQIPLPFPAQQRALVPAWLVTLSVALCPLASAANTFLPDPWSMYAGILAIVSANLSGVAMPQLKFTTPVVPLALVPGALSLAGLLATYAQGHPSPWVHLSGMLAAQLLAALAGKAMPQPTRPV